MRKFIDIVEGRNPDLVAQARDLGFDHNSIPALRELEKLNDFHASFQEKVRERTRLYKEVADEVLPKLQADGKLPMAIGTRFTTPKSIETGSPPWQVVAYYIDPKDIRRYGYRVERDGEKSQMLVSDPAADERMSKMIPGWDRAKDVAAWKPLTGPRSV